jgi:putative glycosyltransferase (TIGR04372 family)
MWLNGNRALDRGEFERFLAWVLRSVAASGLQHYSCVALTSWFRDRTRPAMLTAVYNFLGTMESGAMLADGPPGAVYLIADDTARYIGELAATLDLMNKLIELGRIRRRPIWIMGKNVEVSNPAVFGIWPDTVKAIEPADLERPDHPPFLQINPAFFPYGKRYFLKYVTFALAQREWDRKRRRGLVRHRGLSLRDPAFGRLMAERGWGAEEKIVCFHVREHVYYGQSSNRYTQQFRSSNPEKLRSSLQLLIDRGYKIIRLGASNTHKFSLSGAFFDYANSSVKTPELDVEVARNCDFYFGNVSGPFSLAVAFDKPCCTFDHGQLSWDAMTSRCVYAAKLLVSSSNNRPLSLAEQLGPPLRFNSTQRVLDDHGIVPIENSDEDVLMTLIEFLRRKEREDFLDPSSYGPAQRRALAIFKRHKIVADGLLAETFLNKYDYMLR